MNRITRDDLCRLLETQSVNLVEALPVVAYDAEHIPGAVNVPAALTADLAAALAPDPAGTVVVYCSGPACGRSRVTAAAFERLGYTDVRVYPGGKANWLDAGLPLDGSRTNAAAR
jgi:rhodanese-related sulfurtransferase